MTITTVTSREHNQEVTCAKRAAKSVPVFITDRGKPVRCCPTSSIAASLRERAEVYWRTCLSMEKLAGIDLNPLRARIESSHPNFLDARAGHPDNNSESLQLQNPPLEIQHLHRQSPHSVSAAKRPQSVNRWI